MRVTDRRIVRTNIHLKNTVTRLRPSRASYLEALEAWRSGSISLCAEHLVDSRAPKAIFLRSRCLFRLGRADEALTDLLNLGFEDLLPEHSAQLAVMRVDAFYLTQRRDEASIYEEVAEKLCRSISNPAMKCEMLYYKAIAALIRNDLAELDCIVAKVDESENQSSIEYDTDSYPFTENHWRARIYDAAGVAAALCGDHEKQLYRVATALEIFENLDMRDDMAELGMLINYADVGRISGSKTFARFSASRLEKFQQNIDLVHQLSTAYFNLAECASNDGEQGEALRLLRLATDVAPSGAMQLKGHSRARRPIA